MKQLLILVFSLTSLLCSAQVPQKVAAELFTNTLCSVCGNLEPNISSVINSSDEVITISYYPSSPYQNCFFSKQNKTENDDRTKYYNAFGSTPKIFLQGTAQSNQLSAATLNTFLGKTTDFEIKISNVATSSTDAEVTYTIYRRGNDTTQTANLFLAVQEDSIQYNAPNGINRHYGVFRKALTSVNGEVIGLPSVIGDSVMITKTYTTLPDWDRNLLSAYAILQSSADRKVIQVEKQKLAVGATSVSDLLDAEFQLYPNPVDQQLTITGAEFIAYQIIDFNGRVLANNYLVDQTIDVSPLFSGSYFLRLQTKQNQFTTKLFTK